MKTILKFLVLGFISLLGCSCEEYENPTTDNYVLNDQSGEVDYSVPFDLLIPPFVGEYQGYEIGEGSNVNSLVITESLISVRSKEINRTLGIGEGNTEGKLNCKMVVTLSNGDVITICLVFDAVTRELIKDVIYIKINDGEFIGFKRVENYYGE